MSQPKTTYEIQTGRRIGPKLAENPWNNFGGSRRGKVTRVEGGETEAKLKRDLRALEEVQKQRPKKPPGKT